MSETLTDLHDDSLVTDAIAARFLSCSRRQIHRFVDDKLLPKIVFGRRMSRFRVRDLKALAQRFEVR